LADTQKYVKAILLGTRGKESCVDDVYGIYLHKDGLSDNKPSNVNEVDNIIIVDIRYAGTCGLYEFSREFPTISFTGRRAQVQGHAGDERAQTQASFAGSSIG